MTCYHPIEAYQTKDPNENGKRPLTFIEKTARKVKIACGNCIGCRLERSRQWTVRLNHENQLHELSTFVTLTYEPEKTPEGNTLVKSHFQDFMKRLRQHVYRQHLAAQLPGSVSDPGSGPKIRYFMCGEYGSQTQRPHYHAIIFGLDFGDKVKHSQNPQGDITYTSEKLTELWGFGHCLIGSVTPQSINYVANYLLEKVTGELATKHYESLNLASGEIYNRLPPYINMSNRPGIGAHWFARYAQDVFPSDCTIDRGKALGVPRYYTKLHLRENPTHEDALKASRKRKAIKTRSDNTDDRLRTRKTVKLAQLNQNKGRTL